MQMPKSNMEKKKSLHVSTQLIITNRPLLYIIMSGMLTREAIFTKMMNANEQGEEEKTYMTFTFIRERGKKIT